MIEQMNFMVRFSGLVAELNRLLRMRFSTGAGSKSQVGQSLAAILSYDSQDDYVQREGQNMSRGWKWGNSPWNWRYDLNSDPGFDQVE